MKLKLTIIVVAMVLFISVCMNVFAAEKPVTEDFKIASRTIINNEAQYGVQVEVNGEFEFMIFNASDYNLPSNLFEYGDFIRFRITYTKSDLKVQDCKVINYKKGEIIEDTSEENIRKLFDISYGKNTTEAQWTDTIKLSTLKENEIYKYTATSTEEAPKIENDTGENCAIYIKEKKDDVFEKEIDMVKKMDSGSISISMNEYDSGETFSIMYDKLLTTEEVLNIVNEEEVIKLSKFKDGDVVEHTFEEFIYNDTNKYATIDVKNVVFGQENNKTYTIGKGEIWGFDWMIDTATVTFSDKLEENNNNNNDNNTNTNTNTNTNKNNANTNTNTNTNTNKNNVNANKNKSNYTNDKVVGATNNKVNNQITNQDIPKTGENDIIFIIIFGAVIFSLVKFKKYYDLDEDMK